MKIAFMTFACPTWSANDVIAAAERHGYDGIEWRIDAEHAHGVEVRMDAAQRAALRRRLADAGLATCCIASSLRFNLAGADERRAAIDAAPAIVELAADLGAPGVRVFGGPCPEGRTLSDGVGWAAESLAELAPVAAAHGVQLWLETHDDFAAGRTVGDVLARVNDPAVRANWDVMHPYRGAGESVADTRAALHGRLAHTHFHDCTATGTGGEGICPFGRGYLPLVEMLHALREEGFEGYLSGEWFGQDLGATPDEALATYIYGCREALRAAGVA